KLLRSNQGVWQLRFPGKSRREFRAARLCLIMAEAFPSRCILLRTIEFAAYGILRTGADRRRCAQERHRGTRDRCVVQLRPEHDGGEESDVSRGAARLSSDRWIQVGRSG